jgi:hypothetical protein
MDDVLNVATDDGDVEIRKRDLRTITDAQLAKLRLSRAALQHCWAQAERMMLLQGVEPRDRIRPVATETLDGQWVITLVRYSALNDPLMK